MTHAEELKPVVGDRIPCTACQCEICTESRKTLRLLTQVVAAQTERVAILEQRAGTITEEQATELVVNARMLCESLARSK